MVELIFLSVHLCIQNCPIIFIGSMSKLALILVLNEVAK